MLNILVIGSSGQLGNELKILYRIYPYTFFFTTKEDLNISDKKAVQNFIEAHKINIIINCAAYTAVDQAETDVENADKINHLAVKSLAELAKQYRLKFVHISTDYVFDGTNNRPYTERDIPNPQSVYGKTKLLGEQALLKVNPSKSIIIRTSWLYSSFGNNFFKTMLKLGQEREHIGVVYDQIGTPTYAKDLAKAILNILPFIQNEHVEIYHYSNEGFCSWYDFAKAIMQEAKLTCNVSPIESIQYPTPAKRPRYSVLYKAKIKQTFNLDIPVWQESLKKCLLHVACD